MFRWFFFPLDFVAEATETGEMMSGWKELLIKQELERAGYIQALAKQDISRNQGARRLNVSLTYLSKLIDKYGIHWPARYGQGVGINKVPGGDVSEVHGVDCHVCPRMQA